METGDLENTFQLETNFVVVDGLIIIDSDFPAGGLLPGWSDSEDMVTAAFEGFLNLLLDDAFYGRPSRTRTKVMQQWDISAHKYFPWGHLPLCQLYIVNGIVVRKFGALLMTSSWNIFKCKQQAKCLLITRWVRYDFSPLIISCADEYRISNTSLLAIQGTLKCKLR